jgi:hypothetical protein|tara:strand:- start:6624 stop:7034 length:411 start_codon:yes stop_codon:yes gene_type:complete
MKHDFLKHWRVVRYLIKKQYGLSQQDLELLLFLYSEGRFTKDDFDWYSTIVSWDIRRFIKLKKEGWVKQWRVNRGNTRAIYELTHKGKIAMGRVYRLLLGEEKFPESKRNPIYNPKRSSEKKYLNAMKKINREETT